MTAAVEATAGKPVSRAKVVPISALVGLDRVANTGPDPVITGDNMSTGEYILFSDVSGEIPLAVRPSGGMGMLLKSNLGLEETPVQVSGCIRIRFTGSEASCKISASGSGDTLDSDIGVKGSESGDSNFGVAGSIDLTDIANDTIGELVTVIDGYSEYDCEKVFGDDAESIGSTDIEDITNLQGKSTWAYVWFISTTSGVYKHVFYDDLGTSEKPTLSLQKDGYQDNFLYTGCVVDEFTLSGALKAMVEGSASILGFTETGSQSESGLTLEDQQPLIFYNGDFSIGDNEYTYIRSFDLSMVNNHNADGYGVGSLDRQYHQKSMFGVTGTMQVRLDATSFAERAKVRSEERRVGKECRSRWSPYH